MGKAVPHPIPHQEVLLLYLDYCPSTGALQWKIRPANSVKVGDAAGCWRIEGSFRVRSVGFQRRMYRTSRLIWRMCTGVDPGLLYVDHADGDTTNERWSNLRLATPSDNSCNRGKNYFSVLPKGVTFHKQAGKYQAQIGWRGNGRTSYLGLFSTPEEAAAAYDKAALDNHGEFACVGQDALRRAMRYIGPAQPPP